MDFYMYHGRTDPDGPPQTLTKYSDRVEYHDVDDWGFDGPRLTGVKGFHCTYGSDGEFNLWFESDSAADAAQKLTGWPFYDTAALTVLFDSRHSLVKIHTRDNEIHYFGDWGLI